MRISSFDAAKVSANGLATRHPFCVVVRARKGSLGELNDQKNGNAVRYLIIVSSREPDVYAYLAQRFSGDKRVAVILDRRRAERRQTTRPHELERRQRDRRRAVR